MHIVGTLHPPNHSSGWKILFFIYSWLNPQMQNLGILKVDCIFIEKKNLCTNEPVQFKPFLFKGQQYLTST